MTHHTDFWGQFCLNDPEQVISLSGDVEFWPGPPAIGQIRKAPNDTSKYFGFEVCSKAERLACSNVDPEHMLAMAALTDEAFPNLRE